jgi:hypothetical protein
MKYRRTYGTLFLLLFLFVGCASQQKICPCPQAAKENCKQGLQEGYALLYVLANQEKDVDGLLKIKKTSPANQKLIQGIAEVNRDIAKSLEAWAKNDPENSMSRTGLPEFEEKSRGLIAKHITVQLLFSRKQQSIKCLMIAQHQAMVYEASLLEVLRKSETIKERKKKLAEDKKRVDNLAHGIYAQINVNP